MYLTNLMPLSMPPLRRAERIDGERSRLAQEQREFERERLEREEQREQQRAERRRAEAEATAADLGRAMEINRPGYVASLIIQAARRAKGDLPEAPLSGMAAAIIHAGKARRAEVVDMVLPSHPVARAVTLSGMRRRGDRLTESDEAFLSAFLRKMELRA